MSDDLLSTTQAAGMLGISPIRVRQFIAQGRLAAHKAGRDWLIERTAIEALPARTAGWPPGRSRKGPEHPTEA